jgi:phosphoglycerate dehydrogenase-like enzyme
VLVGVGHIGSEIARLAQTLGMRVIGIRRDTSRMEDGVDEMHPPDRLDEILPRADWLALACPLTDETRGRIDRAALARLPRGARFINVARGEIVDERALIDALGSGQVGGAYLDVFEKEPLPDDSPLWDMPNVIITPHNAGAASGTAARIYEMFWDNLTRLHRSAPLRNEVKGTKAHA